MVIRRRGKIIFFLVFTVLICALMIIISFSFKNNNSFFSVLKENRTEAYMDGLKNRNYFFNNTLKHEPSIKASKKGREEVTSSAGLVSSEFNNLRIQLEKMCKNKGVWSIYIKDLKSGEHLSINNRKMVSASLIKMFIMAKTYQEIYSGDIEKNKEVSEMLKKMITISHNESSNKLVKALGHGSNKSGMKVVNKFATSIHCKNTEQKRDMKDSRSISVAVENYTSVEDCAKLLEKIYKKRCVSPKFDKEMMNLMLAQRRNTKLPALIPRGTKIAHKTGELAQTENDVGIIFGPKTDYIICVMSNKVKNTGEARNLISEISRVVYDHFNHI